MADDYSRVVWRNAKGGILDNIEECDEDRDEYIVVDAPDRTTSRNQGYMFIHFLPLFHPTLRQCTQLSLKLFHLSFNLTGPLINRHQSFFSLANNVTYCRHFVVRQDIIGA
jgi:hypothetical protein